jgi:hypothetical protein
VLGRPKKGEDVCEVEWVLSSLELDVLLFKAVIVKAGGDVWPLNGLGVFIGANDCIGVVSG